LPALTRLELKPLANTTTTHERAPDGIVRSPRSTTPGAASTAHPRMLARTSASSEVDAGIGM
jgi:hypothetical protein